MNIHPLETVWDIVRSITNATQTLVLYIKGNDQALPIFDYSDQHHVINVEGVVPTLTGDRINLTDNGLSFPAAPINNLGDFTIKLELKTSAADFFILDCTRGIKKALQITNKKVVINDENLIYG